MNRRLLNLVLVLGLAISLSPVQAAPKLCPALEKIFLDVEPRRPNTTRDQILAIVIGATIQNLRSDQSDESANYYIRRSTPWFEEALDLDCVNQNGLPYAGAIIQGFDNAFINEPNRDIQWGYLQRFKKLSGMPGINVTMEAQYWIRGAWAARGGGYASSVTEEGWRQFGERMARAERYLFDNKEEGSTVPMWYEEMVAVQTALGRPAEERERVFREGATRYPKYYSLYRQMRTYLDPRWGGSFHAIDRMIQWSTENTKALLGDQMYWQLYTGLLFNLRPEEDFFRDTKVDWKRFVASAREVQRSYPNSIANLNYMASAACEKGDRDLFLEMRKRIGTQTLRDSWTKKAPLELCDAKYGIDS